MLSVGEIVCWFIEKYHVQPERISCECGSTISCGLCAHIKRNEYCGVYVDVDWSKIDPKFEWVAIQPDLTVHAFQNQPRIVNGSWCVVEGGAATSLSLAPYTTCWTLSLEQRPKEVL